MRMKHMSIPIIFLSMVFLSFTSPSPTGRVFKQSARDESLKKGKSAIQMFSKEAVWETLNFQFWEIGGSWDSLPFTQEDVEDAVLPETFDWRELGGVTPVDIQPNYGCGGCWVYAATAVFESLIKIKTGIDVDLSESQIGWCLPNGNHTGSARQAFEFMQYHGITTESNIPCDQVYSRCDYPLFPETYYLNDNWVIAMWEMPLAQRIRVMKYAIQTFGPVASGFTVYEDWGSYQSGVYVHDDSSPYAGGHSIEVVGWADDDTVPNGGYWIIKNDFGEEWGEDGFFRMGYGQCEIDSSFWFASWDPYTQDPVWALKVGTRYYYHGENIMLNISARVPEGRTPEYFATNLPSGAGYDQATGLFTWTPSESQTGVHEIEFFAEYDQYSTSQIGTLIILDRR